ncbi:MAG: aspartate/glutamate racemase family protein [Bifidobacteriaceae bacterium]|jgi:allantoin racemase|nr:aspartate/glutamate racemase family protein [Bifidobacteriaceae bacterium]
MKILDLVPITVDVWTPESGAYIRQHLHRDTEVVTRRLVHGPASIEGEYDEVLAGPEIVAMCGEAEKEGFDAVFVDCFGDPAVRAARECCDIPILGGFEPALYYSLGLADKIGIVTVLPHVVSMLDGLIAKNHLEGRVVSLRHVNIAVLDLHSIDPLVAAVVKQARKAVEADGAGAVVLGCTAIVGVAEAVGERLANEGLSVPVIEAAQAALMLLETHVRMGWRHSRRTYLPPRAKDRTWWPGDGAEPMQA